MPRKRAPGSTKKTGTTKGRTVPRDLEAAKAVSAAVHLQDVLINTFSASAAPRALSAAERSFDQRIRYRVDHNAARRSPLVVSVSMAYEADLEGATVVQIEVQAVALYAFTPGSVSWSADQLDQFAHLNGPYTSWPYLREFISSAAARLRLPRLMLPLWRPPSTITIGGEYRLEASAIHRGALAE